jgi:ribosomal protein S18 acetylase RimI-like enzyme
LTLTIRHASPGDEPAIVLLIRDLALALGERSPADEHHVRRYLASPDTTILLATDDREVVGLVTYCTRPGLFHAGDSAEIEALVVRPERRGEGIGTKLLRTAMRLMQEAGCVEASVSVGAENQRGQRMYFDSGLTDASLRLAKHF